MFYLLKQQILQKINTSFFENGHSIEKGMY